MSGSDLERKHFKPNVAWYWALMYMCVCVYIYIYIYIYIWMYICSVYVRGWVAKDGILSSTFLTGIRVSRGTPLSILAWRPHKEKCLWKPARMKEKDKRCWSVRSETLKLRNWKKFKPKTWGRSVGSKTWVQSSQRVVWSQEQRHRAVKTMTRWVSIFGSCVGFSLYSRDSHA